MILTVTWSTVGDIATLLAAGAALVTVYFARATVSEARKARTEAKGAHAEETVQQAQLLEATVAAHKQEMTERDKAFAAELVLQRLTQLGRITDLLGEVADIARIEEIQPPPLIEGTPFRLTRTTGMLTRLEAAVVVFESLGGPPLNAAGQMATADKMANTLPMKILGDAMSALAETTALAQNHESLVLPVRNES